LFSFVPPLYAIFMHIMMPYINAFVKGKEQKIIAANKSRAFSESILLSILASC